ncbi:uncharacterized protein LOC126833641 [Adelges cooleyi]|uniref:uncharacterized protein LOC126833641 n=1 Tax=Adelges cooleyi TaxID=133065 RepID=UPI0021808A5C|nr:uncharacterized protein LOC126833641 [Adelges cooleyi]
MPFNGNVAAKYLVMASQVIAWCTVSVMLLRKGLNQVQTSSQHQNNDGNSFGNNTASTDDQDTKAFNNNGTPAIVAGIIMIAIALIMLIISPTIMFMKILEKRKERRRTAILESPPKYEDVVESAPRYSSLFVFNSHGDITLLSTGKIVQNKNTTTNEKPTTRVDKPL